MAKVVKVIELMPESPKGWEDAAQNAIREASRTQYSFALREGNDRRR